MGAGRRGGLPLTKALLATTVLLVGSNVFMTPVPANRIGVGRLSLPQLKTLQEAVSLTVFVLVVGRLFELRFRWDFVWARVCLLGAVYFAFRGGLGDVS